MGIRFLKQSLFWMVLFSTAVRAGLSHASEAKTDAHLAPAATQPAGVASQFHRYQGSEGNKKYYLSINSKLDGLKQAFVETENAQGNYGLADEATKLKAGSQQYMPNLNTALVSISIDFRTEPPEQKTGRGWYHSAP